MRGDVIDFHPRLDYSWPANEEGYPIRAFPVGVLLASERGCSAVGPAHHFGSIIAAEDDNGVVRDAQVIELLQHYTDIVVEFLHAGAVEAVLGDHGLVFRLQMRPDMHARRIVPDEE